ncbi:Dynein regulatory complex subunit 3 [Clonorchis sinensis]|uniref:Dynein regulatory complex subunit 3 n=1 Tax=Clonorchis sinensis TaxID=79923 RepID=A0A8T1M770_CLOSI|nr:Dynein regulatory complex subunit 3 [Clonorchis sinensis]
MNVEPRPISAKTVEQSIPNFEIFQGTRIQRLWGTTEPTVITDTLLRAAVYAQGPKEEAGRIARVEGIEFSSVGELGLNFQNIFKISNLDAFTNLTRLQLDNNIIEKIENLDALTNLTWLDLSFNRIEKIENLENLHNLEDISLFNNQIKVIEGLDNLKKLKYLSLGRNLLDDLENTVYLRKFRGLRSLTLEENPLTSDANYRPYIFAFLAQLEYLDYQRIGEEARHAAYMQYQITVDQMNEKMKEEEEYEEICAYRAEQAQYHANAFVDDVEGDNLYDLIMRSDPDGMKFLSLPLVGEVVEQFRDKLADSSRMLFHFGLEEYAKRQQEEDCLREAIREVKVADREAGMKLIREFMDYKQNALQRLEAVPETQTTIIEEIFAAYREKIHELWDQLMANEMVISEQIEEVCTDFGRNIHEMVAFFLENTQNYLSKCREAANNFHDRLVEATLPYAERLGKADPQEAEQLLFPDRETMANCLAQSKENQAIRIEMCEERIQKRARAWCEQLIESLNREEIIQRHLNRVTEINLFVDGQRTELDSFDLGAI